MSAGSEVLADFASAAELSHGEAEAILPEVARAIVQANAPAVRHIEARKNLLRLLHQLAAGDATIGMLAKSLPFAEPNARRYLTNAARAFLAQAERDTSRGFIPEASVWGEVRIAAAGRAKLAFPRKEDFQRPSGSAGELAGQYQRSGNPGNWSGSPHFDASNAAAPPPAASPIPKSENFPWRPPATLQLPDLEDLLPYAPSIVPSAIPSIIPGAGWLRGLRNLRFPRFGKPRSASPAPPPDVAPAPPTIVASPLPPPVVMNDPSAPLPPATSSPPLVMSSPNAGRVRAPGLPAFEGPGADEFRVWFGTNRAPDEGGAIGSGNRRGDGVAYGYCDVYIPESHKIGSTGSSWLWRLVHWTDDRLKVRDIAALAYDAFWAILRQRFGSLEASRRQAVVFIHGYNVSFEEAALRAAQIGVDLGVGGAMAFFSWPSKGTVNGYQADESTIEASEPAISQFLIDFARRSGAEAVHVIAHSMGNRGLLRAVSGIVQNAQAHSDVRFANFILAAPDVDADTFRNSADAYRQLADRTTLYISERDRAVGLSRWLHQYPRVGFAPPISVFQGIDTINVTNIDVTMLGHGYFGEARPILTDMHELIFSRRPPDKRFSLRSARTEAGQDYWVVAG